MRNDIVLLKRDSHINKQCFSANVTGMKSSNKENNNVRKMSNETSWCYTGSNQTNMKMFLQLFIMIKRKGVVHHMRQSMKQYIYYKQLITKNQSAVKNIYMQPVIAITDQQLRLDLSLKGVCSCV